ncbi:MAG: hypothetical protein HY459_04450 [Parcubacteria group bacterium]|nr:hypothetical protein [Parcubacteria group bacterium]
MSEAAESEVTLLERCRREVGEVIIEWEGHYYKAWSPSVYGCFGKGATPEEAVQQFLVALGKSNGKGIADASFVVENDNDDPSF